MDEKNKIEQYLKDAIYKVEFIDNLDEDFDTTDYSKKFREKSDDLSLLRTRVEELQSERARGKKELMKRAYAALCFWILK